MLIAIREKASGIFAYIIVGIISVPFALWGIHEYLGGGGELIVANVGDVEITKREFDSQLQQQRAYLQQIMGGSYNLLYSTDEALKQSVVDMVVRNALMINETQRAGFAVSDQSVFKQISEVPQFQVDGKFDPQRYEQLLQMQRRSKVEFEEQLRQDIRIKQLETSVPLTTFLSQQDKQRYGELNGQTRSFSFLMIDVEREGIEVSEEQMRAYHEENAALFQSPEQVKLEYVELKQSDIFNQIQPAEEELLAFYEGDIARYQNPELRKASHILLKLGQEATEEEVQAVEQKAQSIAEQLQAGKTFADLAKEHSQDSVSADQGGDLGFLARGDIDNPEFIDTLFRLEKGAISAPVRTRLGMQIVKLDDVQAGTQKPFAEVRDAVANELRQEQAEREFVNQAETLLELSFENEDTLEVAASELGIPVTTTAWVGRDSNEGIFGQTKVRSAAFSEELIQSSKNSDLIELEDGHAIVIRVAEYKPKATLPFEQAKEDIQRVLREQTRIDMAKRKGQKALDQLRSEDVSMQALAEDLGYEYRSYDALRRDDNKVDPDLLNYVFQLPTPAQAGGNISGYLLNNGRYAVVDLAQVMPGDSSADSVDASAWAEQQSAYGLREMEALISAIKETSDVRVFEENL